MEVTYLLLQACLGLVIVAQAQDCPRPVGGDNMNLKGNDILLETFPNGTKVTFACDIGYVSAGGSALSTCAAGIWSPVKLKCKIKNCGAFEDVPNGHVEYTEGTEFGDKIVITCSTGYRFVGKQEPREILCGEQGWMGRVPVCEVVTCEPPPMIVNGTFIPNKEIYEYREVVQYSCQKDLTLNGPKSISCSDDGTFQPGPPTCVKVSCGHPNVENADWVEGSRPPYGYKATATFKCRSGYTMIGPSSQICDINSQWSPKLQCEKVPMTTKATTTTTTTTTKKTTGDAQCEDPNVENAERVEGSRPPYGYKATATFKCISGYTMKGQPIQTCEVDGQWSPGLPKCESSNGNKYVVPLVISLAVISAVATCCGCFYFGIPARIRKKLGSGRGSPDNEATKPEEEVALS